MSILVKGMQMPSACGICDFNHYYYCAIAKQYCGSSGIHERASFCPLVELPEKHGDLVDRDALIQEHFSPEHRIALSEANKAWMRKIINDAPKILEAEDE